MRRDLLGKLILVFGYLTVLDLAWMYVLDEFLLRPTCPPPTMSNPLMFASTLSAGWLFWTYGFWAACMPHVAKVLLDYGLMGARGTSYKVGPYEIRSLCTPAENTVRFFWNIIAGVGCVFIITLFPKRGSHRQQRSNGHET